MQVQTEINHFFDKIDNDRIKTRMVHDTCKLSKMFKIKESQPYCIAQMLFTM